MGAIIVNIIIALIIGTTMFFAIKNGFVKTALGALGFFIAATVAICFCSSLGGVISDGALGTRLEAAIDSAVDSVVTYENYEAVFEDDEAEEDSALEKLFAVFGADNVPDSLREGYTEQRDKGLEIAKDYIKNGVKEKAVPFICRVIAFLVLYLGMRLLLKIAELVLDKLTKLPVLKQADKTLGALLGVMLSALRACVFCAAVRVIVPVSSALGLSFIANAGLTDALLYKLFDVGNLLNALI